MVVAQRSVSVSPQKNWSWAQSFGFCCGMFWAWPVPGPTWQVSPEAQSLVWKHGLLALPLLKPQLHQ